MRMQEGGSTEPSLQWQGLSPTRHFFADAKGNCPNRGTKSTPNPKTHPLQLSFCHPHPSDPSSPFAATHYLLGTKNNDSGDPKDTSWRHDHKSCSAPGPQGCSVLWQARYASQGDRVGTNIFISLLHLSELTQTKTPFRLRKVHFKLL